MGRGLDGSLLILVWRCAVLKDRWEGLSTFSGGYGEGETPLPIPNREVKPLSADGTWPARAWESRTPPVLHYTSRPSRRLVFVKTPCAACAARAPMPLPSPPRPPAR